MFSLFLNRFACAVCRKCENFSRSKCHGISCLLRGSADCESCKKSRKFSLGCDSGYEFTSAAVRFAHAAPAADDQTEV